MNASNVEIMDRIRSAVPGEVFDYQCLLGALVDYGTPRNKITQLLNTGLVVRIRKGLYCFGSSFRKTAPTREYLANLIYGPSYVSLDYALSYHGLIPEDVATVTSVTPVRSAKFDTPFGNFSYRMLSGERYSCGANLIAAGDVTFLIAGPEKALIDKVWVDKRFSGRNISDFETYLIEDLRIESDMLRDMNQGLLRAIASAYDSLKIHNLIKFLKQVKGGSRA
jgi:predicted transcriptional regulator of viral defense system